MNPGAALDLRDIHLPAEPSWWPPAPGWWLLALIVIALLVYLGRRLLGIRRRHRQRRHLLRALADVRKAHPLTTDAPAALAAASELLRRACRRHAPDALTLQGEAWLQFLDDDREDAPFSRGPGRLLLDGPYRPRVDADEAARALDLVAHRLARFPDHGR